MQPAALTLTTRVLDHVERTFVGADLSRASDDLATAAESMAGDLAPLAHDLVSPARGNVLAALALPGGRALEIGAGAGAVTRHLAETGHAVDAWEPDRRLADLARLRCADLDAVEVRVGDLGDAVAHATAQTDTHTGGYDLVVRLVADDEAVDVVAETRALAALLSHDGLLVLGIENPAGLHRTADAARPVARSTATARDLEQAAASAGLAADVLGALPGHRTAYSVVDVARLAERAPAMLRTLAGVGAATHGPTDPTTAETVSVLWAAACADGRAVDLVDSFLLLAGRHPQGAHPFLATNMSVNRRAAQSATNVVAETDDGLVVRREHRFPEAADSTLAPHLRPVVEPVLRGRGLVDALAEAPDLAAALLVLGQWVDLVRRDGRTEVDGVTGVWWDLIPRNVVVTDDGLRAFDQEWFLPAHDVDTVLRRGCFWTADDLVRHPRQVAWLPTRTVGALASVLAAALVEDDEGAIDLDRFYREEAAQVGAVWRPAQDATDHHRMEQTLRARAEGSTDPHQEGDPGDVIDTGSSPALVRLVERLLAQNRALTEDVAELEAAAHRTRLERDRERLQHRDHALGLSVQVNQLQDSTRALAASQGRVERRSDRLEERLETKNARIAALRERLASAEAARRAAVEQTQTGGRTTSVLRRVARRLVRA